jgi:hypothetical protein
MVKRAYVAPSLIVIGRITALTGMMKLDNYLDNNNGSNAWRVRPTSGN